jgi:hypothetical protein
VHSCPVPMIGSNKRVIDCPWGKIILMEAAEALMG